MMAHNNQIVNGRGVREMERRRLRGMTTRETTMQWHWQQWCLRKKAAAAMVVVIIDCAALWRQSMVAVAMAVFVAGGGGHC